MTNITGWKRVRGVPRRRKILVLEVPDEVVRAAAALSTDDLIAMAAGGDVVARAALIRYRHYQWRGVVN